MARVMIRERQSRVGKEVLFLGLGAGFGVGYLMALMQHQAELTRLLTAMQ